MKANAKLILHQKVQPSQMGTELAKIVDASPYRVRSEGSLTHCQWYWYIDKCKKLNSLKKAYIKAYC